MTKNSMEAHRDLIDALRDDGADIILDEYHSYEKEMTSKTLNLAKLAKIFTDYTTGIVTNDVISVAKTFIDSINLRISDSYLRYFKVKEFYCIKGNYKLQTLLCVRVFENKEVVDGGWFGKDHELVKIRYSITVIRHPLDDMDYDQLESEQDEYEEKVEAMARKTPTPGLYTGVYNSNDDGKQYTVKLDAIVTVAEEYCKVKLVLIDKDKKRTALGHIHMVTYDSGSSYCSCKKFNLVNDTTFRYKLKRSSGTYLIRFNLM
jgi:hypothetical protein